MRKFRKKAKGLVLAALLGLLGAVTQTGSQAEAAAASQIMVEEKAAGLEQAAGETNHETTDQFTAEAVEEDIYASPTMAATSEFNKAAAAENCNLAFLNDDGYAWKVTEKDGRTCVTSGNDHTDNSESSFSVTFTLKKAGTLSFDYLISSEDWDHGYFYVDEVKQGDYHGTGITQWNTVNLDLSAGEHTLVWRYKKDYSECAGDDAFYVDNICVDVLTFDLSKELNVEGGSLVFTNDEAYPWQGEESEGRVAGASPNVPSGMSSISTTVTVGKHYMVQFYYRTSYWGSDEFYVDGERISLMSSSSFRSMTCILKEGTHTLTWTYRGNGFDEKRSYLVDDVAILPAPVPTSLNIEGPIKVSVNKSEKLKYTIEPSDTPYEDCIFISDDPAVATVDESGQVIGISPGRTRITVLNKEVPSVKDTVIVNVFASDIPASELCYINTYYSEPQYIKAISTVTAEETWNKESALSYMYTPEYAYGRVYGYNYDDFGVMSLDDPEDGIWYENVLEKDDSISCLTVDYSRECLFAILQRDKTNYLIRVCLENGQYEILREWPYGSIAADMDGTIYTMISDSLAKYDPDKNTITTVVKFNDGNLSGGDLIIDRNKGALFLHASPELYFLNVKTGTAEKLFLYNIPYGRGFFTITENEPDYDPSPFTDLKDPGKYWYKPVLWAYYANPQITTGKTADMFMPNENCTRAEVVTFLWRLAGCPEPTITKNPFQDVKQYNEKGNEIYYYKPVLWALERGITTGKSATEFDPKGTCKRKEFVTFLWRAYGSPDPFLSQSPFKDVQDSGKYWYKPVLWALENGITTGTGPDTFDPDVLLSRKQVVTFMYRGFLEEGRP